MKAKVFKFFAKQGQHGWVAKVLEERFQQIVVQVPMQGGVMVKMFVPANSSKRKIDRVLHSKGTPGARSRANKIRIIGGESWEVSGKIGLNVPFMRSVQHGKRRKLVKMKLVENYPYCTCCGPSISMVPA